MLTQQILSWPSYLLGPRWISLESTYSVGERSHTQGQPPAASSELLLCTWENSLKEEGFILVHNSDISASSGWLILSHCGQAVSKQAGASGGGDCLSLVNRMDEVRQRPGKRTELTIFAPPPPMVCFSNKGPPHEAPTISQNSATNWDQRLIYQPVEDISSSNCNESTERNRLHFW